MELINRKLVERNINSDKAGEIKKAIRKKLCDQEHKK